MIGKLALLLLVLAACHCCDMNPNRRILIIDAPTLISNNSNGQKLLIGKLDDPQQNYIYVAKLKGTPYEMGKAFGELFKDELQVNVGTFYDYYLDQLSELLIKNHVPKLITNSLTKGVRRLAYLLLDLNVMITKKYTNFRYL